MIGSSGLQYSLVGVQGLLQQSAVGALGEHLHRRRDDGSQLGSHQIAAGAGNGPAGKIWSLTK